MNNISNFERSNIKMRDSLRKYDVIPDNRRIILDIVQSAAAAIFVAANDNLRFAVLWPKYALNDLKIELTLYVTDIIDFD
jgi:hypothetical protein